MSAWRELRQIAKADDRRFALGVAFLRGCGRLVGLWDRFSGLFPPDPHSDRRSRAVVTGRCNVCGVTRLVTYHEDIKMPSRLTHCADPACNGVANVIAPNDKPEVIR